MAAPASSEAPRHGNPPSGPPFPNYNPGLQRTAELSQNLQNLNVNPPSSAIRPGPPPSVFGPARPSLNGQASPFQTVGPPASFPGHSTVPRPVAPLPGMVARATTAPIQSPQNASSRPPQGSFPISGPVTAASPGAFSSPPSGFLAAPPPSSVRPSGIGSPPPPSVGPVANAPPPSVGPVANAPPLVASRPMSNVPPPFPAGAPRFPVSGGIQQPTWPPPSTATVRTPPQASIRPSFPGNVRSASSGTVSQVSSLSPAAPFPSAPQFVPPTASPFGSQPWKTEQHQAAPPSFPGSGATTGMYLTAPSFPHANGTMPNMSQTGTVGGSNRLDPNQVPRPLPSSSIILHETRQNNQANPPPPATSTYIVQDTGNCSPRHMRCTMNQIPCTSDLLGSSGMQLALLVQPLAVPHPSEEPIQIVDFGESGPVRCSRCKGYMNPFMKFIDQGRRFICNMCGHTDETPHDYQCNLRPDGRRSDADERPELCRGTVEFLAPKEYMVRDPMPAVFFFLVDVSMNAIQTGATAAACSAINQVIADLPEGPRTMVGVATFDSTIHFYNLKRALQQPLMLIVPDIQDVYTPLASDIIVPLSECRQHLELLLESIPTMYQNSKPADSAFGAAIKAAFLAMKKSGGKLLVFQSVLPSIGIGALSDREADGRANIIAEKEANKLLQPQDAILREMAIELAEYQVCVDVFLTTQSYVDIASISVVPRTTGGQVYYYFPFSAVSDTAKLYNDLRWNVTRPQGFEAVMRVRCSQGLQVQEYLGNFCRRIPTDIDMPGIDSDKTIMVTLMIDDKLQDGSECSFQCALLYTTVYGQRRIRVSTLSLPCTSNLLNIYRTADVDAQLGCRLKQAAMEIPRAPQMQIREQVKNNCINILHSYRKFCSTGSSSGQLIIPEGLKLLPLYTLALMKSTGLRTDGRIDNCSFWISYVSSVSASWAVPLVYPRMISVHDLASNEIDQSTLPNPIPPSSEHVSDGGIYLLENGMDALIYVGSSVDPQILQQLFGTSSVDEIPNQLVLQQFDNPLSRRFNEVVNEIRQQRCSYLSLKLCKKGDPSGTAFFSYLVEDKTPMSLSYVEFLVYIHRQIQTKMS